jgi:hypothetical protein
MAKFTPINVVKKKRPAWMTPDFNPQIADENFTPYSVIPVQNILQLLAKYLRK